MSEDEKYIPEFPSPEPLVLRDNENRLLFEVVYGEEDPSILLLVVVAVLNGTDDRRLFCAHCTEELDFGTDPRRWGVVRRYEISAKRYQGALVCQDCRAFFQEDDLISAVISNIWSPGLSAADVREKLTEVNSHGHICH